MKEVKKAKEAANSNKQSQGFGWDIGGALTLGGSASTAATESKPKQEQPQK